MKQKIYFLFSFIVFIINKGSTKENLKYTPYISKNSCSFSALCGDGFCCKFNSGCFCSHYECETLCSHGDLIPGNPIKVDPNTAKSNSDGEAAKPGDKPEGQKIIKVSVVRSKKHKNSHKKSNPNIIDIELDSDSLDNSDDNEEIIKAVLEKMSKKGKKPKKSKQVDEKSDDLKENMVLDQKVGLKILKLLQDIKNNSKSKDKKIFRNYVKKRSFMNQMKTMNIKRLKAVKKTRLMK